MRAILVCCLLATNLVYSDSSRSGWPYTPRHYMLKKADEVAGSGFRRTSSNGTSTGCVADCAIKANEMLSADAETTKHLELGNKAYRYIDQFKPSVVNVMCTQTVEFLEFHVHALCYYRVNNEMLTACNTKYATMKATLESDMAREMQSVADVDAFIRHFCEYMDCNSDCDLDKIKEECGADAAHIMQGFYKKSVDALRGPLAQKGFAIPSVCNNIGKFNDDE